MESRRSSPRRRWGRRLFPVVATALLVVVLAPHPLAFGPTGHRTVGRIAEKYLSPAAAAEVQRLLGTESLARAATWPDDIRSDPKWAHAAPWHYVTIEDGETYASSAKNPAGDAVEALGRFLGILGDDTASDAEKVVALRWVVHLVGDLHQPLHVGRGKDQGGNTIQVEWHGEKTNLHTVWDSSMIDSTQLSFSELAEFIDSPPVERVREWQPAPVDEWVKESLQYRKRAYTPPDKGVSGSYSYSFGNLPLVELRLTQAGVRTAALLNRVLGDGDVWEGMPDGLHWFRNSAEYRALSRQVYVDAAHELLSRKDTGRLPTGTWVVALDADETVLDNSLYQVEQLGQFDPVTWSAWVNRAEAGAVPGAREFLRLVRSLGGKVAIVSNRRAADQIPTVKNLSDLGLAFDLVLLQERDPEKEPRWDLIESGVTALGEAEILLYLGDSITDFPGLDQDLRHRPDPAFARFGTDWFVLPNPVYGSWEANPRR